ncbi:c-type cytochrome [Aquabacterium sp.]|uniref:c-type cytochrome n=1 Tax=Aquabacterium sp. TaxID=1872578 RepID=UPI002B616729|nr:c-type cytochrome [Aquabacterium sp.]HSW04485.1 c-type cytochrome [Aquabacterium sp.]
MLLLAASATRSHAQGQIERGRYLVQSISACGNCHTPRGLNGPLKGKAFAGGAEFAEPAFKAYAPNITPDPQTGIGRWTTAQVITAIREGKRPDGTIIGPPMPIARYRGISDRDAVAIAAYLRSLPAVANKVPKSEYKIPLPLNYGPPVGHVADVAPGNKIAQGHYLAGPLGHCIECHSAPGPNGAPDVENNLGTGGIRFDGPWGSSVSSNLTPSNLARFSDMELRKIITTGVRPDGSLLKPPMATNSYARMSNGDLDALIAYLRQLPRK